MCAVACPLGDQFTRFSIFLSWQALVCPKDAVKVQSDPPFMTYLLAGVLSTASHLHHWGCLLNEAFPGPTLRASKLVTGLGWVLRTYFFLWVYFDLFDQFPVIAFFTFLLVKISVASLGNSHTACYKTFKKSDGNIFFLFKIYPVSFLAFGFWLLSHILAAHIEYLW